MKIESHIEAAIKAHIEFGLAAASKPGPGQSRTLKESGIWTRLGRYPDGRYFLDASWSVEEAYDDDFGAQSCGCKRAGSPHIHCHRIAGTMEALLMATTEPHSSTAAYCARKV